MRACLETQKLEQLEARMDEIADRVARDRTSAARESPGISERDLEGAAGGDSIDPQTRLSKPAVWRMNDEDFDVLADGAVVGRIFNPTPRP
jgi:hypothetical protein